MGEVDYLLKVTGIAGESKDSKHSEDLQIDSWTWSAKAPKDAATGMGTGKAQASDVQFTMKTNSASPLLAQALKTNQDLPTATLICRKAGPKGEALEFFKLTLKNAKVSQYQVTGGQGSILPVDQFNLNFHSMEIEYCPQTSAGLGGSRRSFVWSLGEYR